VPKKCKTKELDVFQGRSGRANAAIFDALARESPQNIKQLLKRITRYEGLEETYYASLTKRLRNLKEAEYLEETKQAQASAKEPTFYQLTTKAFLAMFLRENSMQDIMDKATRNQRAYILLALLNACKPKEAPSEQS
jgi:hypothetical protein